jgi:hypothetical protein
MWPLMVGDGKEIEPIGFSGAKRIGGCACAIGVARMVVEVAEIAVHA